MNEEACSRAWQHAVLVPAWLRLDGEVQVLPFESGIIWRQPLLTPAELDEAFSVIRRDIFHELPEHLHESGTFRVLLTTTVFRVAFE